MSFLISIAGLFLAAIFWVAGIAKLFDREGSVKALRDFGLPEWFANFFGLWLPIFEITLATGLIFRETARFAGLGALILLAIFSFAMAHLMSTGKSPNCHCFGQVYSEPISWKSLVRNILLTLVALFLVTFGNGIAGFDVLTWLAEMNGGAKIQLVLSFGILGLVIAAIFYLRKIIENQLITLRRIEILEFLQKSDGEETREEFALPSEGLPIGAISPTFSLPNLDGKRVTLGDVLVNGKTVALFFVAPNCSPCDALLPEIVAWKMEFSEKLDFIFISNGKPKENRAKFGDNEVLLQNDDEIAVKFKAQWTPAVVLVNAEGNVASRLAVGDAAIRELFVSVAKQNELKFVQRNASAIIAGDVAPELEFRTATGEILPENSLRNNKNLVLFWSRDCSFCGEMLEDLREWEISKNGNSPNLIVVTKETEALDLRSSVVIESDEISKKLGKNGTPSAVLIDENWHFASEVAVGAEEIWALVR